jgi:hypothetical protein
MSQAEPEKDEQKSLINPLKKMFENRIETKSPDIEQSKRSKRRRQLDGKKTVVVYKESNLQNVKDFMDRSLSTLKPSNDNSIIIVSEDDNSEQQTTTEDDDVEREFKKLKKSQSSHKENMFKCESNSEFSCVHCNKFICDLETGELKTEHLKTYQKHIPKCVTVVMNAINCKNLYVIEKESMSTAGLASNSDVKFAFNQNTEQNEHVLFNAYIDGSDESCWQFTECKFCFNLIAFSLKFTNNQNLTQMLNKYFLITI